MALFPSISSEPQTMPPPIAPKRKRKAKAAPDTEINFVHPDPEDTQKMTSSGIGVTQNDDGTVDIDFHAAKKKKTAEAQQHGFDANLALDGDYSSLSAELIQGIEADIESRRERDMLFEKGLKLLGVKIEEVANSALTEGSVSRAFHPILLEATVRYQANASAEMLPSDGPVKIRNDHYDTDSEIFRRAEDFEISFNRYLTTTRREYYPDTRRMFTGQGFFGNGFKKIYNCPLRRAPVSDYVSEQDLIISNDAVSLYNAGRVTHRSIMRPSVMKRMQHLGVYADNETFAVPSGELSRTGQAIKTSEGISSSFRQEDKPHTIMECYTDVDPAEYGLEEPGAPEGLPLPYRVTLDKDSRRILAIYRNWEEGDKDYTSLVGDTFVKYGFLPSLGFYDWGLVHLLGNTARILTAGTRMLLDAGQYANFPGFLLSERASRQETTQIRIQPGAGQTIKTGGADIRTMAMPLPYKEPSSVLMTLVEKIADDGRKLGMIAEVNVGEGRADVPVGTTIALIEQGTKVLASVHKQNHSAQQQEFEALRKLIAKNPTVLNRGAKDPQRMWRDAAEFNDFELSPASDPNVPSHIHRVMMAQALVQLVNVFPEIKRMEALQIILTTIGFSAEALINPVPPPPPGQQQPPPDPSKMATVQLKAKELDMQEQDMQRKAANEAAESQAEQKNIQLKAAAETANIQSRERIAAMQEETARAKLGVEAHNAHADRTSDNVNAHLDRTTQNPVDNKE